VTQHHPLSSPLFPYTTLFRSRLVANVLATPGAFPADRLDRLVRPQFRRGEIIADRRHSEHAAAIGDDGAVRKFLCAGVKDFDVRSEEHTSELQSREKLVCRLL